jgi:parvulin-like peptidyl-prolyl isomerase
MQAETLISIDSQPISLRQTIGYLRAAGELPRFVQTVLRQHLLEQQLQSRSDLELDPSQLEQAIVNFRMQNRLVTQESFDQWLQTQRITYADFRNQFAKGIKIAGLKNQLIAAKVEEFFSKNKEQLATVVLSRIVVGDVSLAEELMRQLIDDRRPFEKLAREHSLTDDRLYNGMMGRVSVAQLPQAIREAIAGAKPGDLIGPVAFEGRYCLFRIEQWQPASLEGQLKREIEDRMFELWVQEQLKNKNIQLHLE